MQNAELSSPGEIVGENYPTSEADFSTGKTSQREWFGATVRTYSKALD